MNYRIESNSWEDLEYRLEEAKKTVIIPVGSIEQHGKHLPLGTDSFVAESLANQVAEKCQAFVAPTIWCGWSPHHMALPGTITIRTEVLIELLYDMMDSLAKHGFENFVLINGHRIVNVIWMQISVQKVQEKHDIKVIMADPAYLSKDLVSDLGFGPVGHAEEIETSHMLHINENLVHMDRAIDNPIPKRELYSVDPRYPHDTLCYVPTTLKNAQKDAREFGGCHGEPSKSSKEKGKRYNDYVVNHIVKSIENMRRS